MNDGNTVKKLEVLRKKAEWCLHPDDSFMDTPAFPIVICDDAGEMIVTQIQFDNLIP